eukprot:gene4690-6402_t
MEPSQEAHVVGPSGDCRRKRSYGHSCPKDTHMRVRNWLLTGTSLTFLAFAPVGAAHAQDANDPALAAAFQAYQADQSDAARQKLNEACIAAGFQSLDDCIAALSGGNTVKEPAPAAPAEPAPAADAPAADAPTADAPAADTPPPAEAAP